MKTKELPELISQMVERIVEQFNPERIMLFGSYASGSPDYDSDVDLLVVIPVEGSVRETACAIDAALSDRTVPLDLIVLTPQQFERERGIVGTIAHEAVREGKVLYERAA